MLLGAGKCTCQNAFLDNHCLTALVSPHYSCHLWHGSGGGILKNRKISINYWFLRPCTHNLVKMQILGNFK